MCLSVGAVPHWNAQDSISAENAHVVGGTGSGFSCHRDPGGLPRSARRFCPRPFRLPGGGWSNSGLRGVSSTLGAVRGWASLPAWPSWAAELKGSLTAMTTASSLSLGSEHPKADRLCAQRPRVRPRDPERQHLRASKPQPPSHCPPLSTKPSLSELRFVTENREPGRSVLRRWRE